MKSRSKCVILVPIKDYPEMATQALLDELKRLGYEVRTLYGCTFIDKSRSYMATQSLREGFDELMWIDSDITFDPGEIDRLRAHDLPLVCGLYPKKTKKKSDIAAAFLPGCSGITFGCEGGLFEIRYAATGFLYTKREVYESIERKFDLPLCENGEDLGDIVPYFFPMIWSNGDKHIYMGEDFSFCERARQCGYKIYADTRVRLGHIGKYRYSWEDMSGDRPRAQTFELEFEE